MDVGGLEECFPTIGGAPDHGSVWSRPWRTIAPTVHVVDAPEGQLRRELVVDEAELDVRYALTAAPGTRFLWAGHLLLDLDPASRLEAPTGALVRCTSHGDARSRWPAGPHGEPLDRLGPVDGTAVKVLLPGTDRVRVVRGDGASLTITVRAPGQPVAVALWRNLGGWPAGDPYRSLGVEPSLGHHDDLALAGDGAATVGDDGLVRWRVRYAFGG